MTNMNHTKKALLTSALSLLLCFSMLIGTTFAWFTDSVTSANNIIKTGTLDVDVYYGDPEEEESIEGVSELFDDVTLWEPGAVAYENLSVVNKGSLALKYMMTMSFTNENYVIDGEYDLSQILQVGLVAGGIDEGLTRDEVLASVDEWRPMEEFTLEGELLAHTNDETIGMVIYWEPSSNDNLYNVNNGKVTSDGAESLHIDLGVTLVATQLSSESDRFDETYDEDATYPAVVGGVLEEGATSPLTLNVGRITVVVPVGAPAGAYKLSVESLSVETAEDGSLTLNTDFGLLKDGVAVQPDAATYDVFIQTDLMAEIKSVYHIDEEITDYTYDAFTGKVSFKTASFSPFTVNYDLFGTEVVVDEATRTIQRGFFEGVNPATLDASLLGDSSEYIAVDYVKDGVKHYAVSKRATTVILGDNDDGGSGYTFENGNYTVKMVNDNALHSVISGLQSNAHSTVYILPGTYEEATTINVYSNMDIIGLGDAEEIKIVKGASSNSNRHLFNCNGTKEDYIEVTIRNMTLDAKNKTTNNKDNAAVQSIRKTKVKCYDLIIQKGTGWSDIAFYVNGNNAVNGVKYTAYLYAENCTINSTRSFSVVTTSGTYRFYYDNLIYGSNSTYSTNRGSIQNKVLDWNDWDW